MESISKKQLIDEESDSGSRNKEPVNILNFCDDLIINIFSFLPHDDLVKMDSVCTTFSRISKDWTLWKYVYFNMYNRSMEEIYLRYLNNRTLHISIRGTDLLNFNSSISSGFIHQLGIKCPNITLLSLSYQKFGAVQRNHRFCFPKLKSLNIDHFFIFEIVDYDYSIFENILLNCPNIEDVNISFSIWSHTYYFYDLSNLNNLKHLSLQQLNLEFDTYLQLFTVIEDGFSNLQILDLRFTVIDDIWLLCFQKLKSLKSIFLHNSDVNYNSSLTITDYGLSVFERPHMNRQHSGNRCEIEHLYVRNYPNVTNQFLRNTVPLCPSLKTLDVTGTSCTIDGVIECQKRCPHIKIVI